ncbi:MAG: exonuclease SbcCD subunit D [Candidatus Latescibacteria bacterium]|jgi:exonuclease SbcD|nr:exonuclease SbcCD subunit D [Candidatus Latescibacterota bacterium]
MAIKFLHVADTHVGVENYGRLDSGTGLHTRLQDFIKSLRFAFDEAIKDSVDLVIFAGDAYRSCDPTPTHQREFASLIRMLSAEQIPVVMITGNHDSPVAFGKASSLDIFGTLGTEGVHIASDDRLTTIRTKSGPIQIACLPWLHRSRLLAKGPYQNLSQEEVVEQLQDLGTAIIEGLAARVDPGVPAVLVGHLAAADATLSGSEQTAIIGRDPVFLTSTLANSAFDYIALGHIHKFQDLNANAQPPVVYSGSIERIDFGEEKETKGVVMVTIEDGDTGRKTSYKFVRTPARPFQTISVQVAEDQDPTSAVLEAIGKHTLTDAIVRVIYDLSGHRTDTVDLKAIKKALESSFMVASIAPKPKAQTSQRRASISEDMGIKDALHAYIQNHPQLEDMEDNLQLYGASLEAELRGEV